MSLVAWLTVVALAGAAPDEDEGVVIGPPIAPAAGARAADVFARWTSHLRGFVRDEPAGQRLRLGSTLSLGLDWSPAASSSWAVALEARLRHRLDALGDGGASGDDEVGGDFAAEVRRAVLRWQLGCRELTAGIDTPRWGRTLARPTDVVSPLDWREGPLPPEGDERVPVLLVSLRQPLGQGEARLMWVPFYFAARVPGVDPDAGPRADLVHSSELAARLTQRLGELDLALVWQWGFDRTAALPPVAMVVGAPARRHAVGIELALAAGPWRIAAEGALLSAHGLYDRALAETRRTVARWAAQLAVQPAVFLDLAVELEGAHAPRSEIPTWHEGPDDLWLRARLGLLLAFDGVVRLDAETRVGLLRDDWWWRAGLAVRVARDVELAAGIAFFGGDTLDLGLGGLYDGSDQLWLRFSLLAP